MGKLTSYIRTLVNVLLDTGDVAAGNVIDGTTGMTDQVTGAHEMSPQYRHKQHGLTETFNDTYRVPATEAIKATDRAWLKKYGEAKNKEGYKDFLSGKEHAEIQTIADHMDDVVSKAYDGYLKEKENPSELRKRALALKKHIEEGKQRNS